MIKLHRLNQEPFILNNDLIEIIENIPDTIVTLTSGNKYIVRESAHEICELVIQFRRLSNQPLANFT